jgi:F-type H+-transporting ATPase subunit gamma
VAGKRGLLVLSANRGLAGGFNSNIIHFTEQSLAEKPADTILVLGQACRSHLIQKGFPVEADFDLPLDPPTMDTARDLSHKLVRMLDRGEIDSFDIIYTAYRSSVKMEPVLRRLFPLNPDTFGVGGMGKSNYSFEPSPEHLLASMVVKYLKGYIYGCLAYSYICELTSRLAAMDSAIRNGNEMLDKLSLQYNRSRQALITQEITEIVAGATALVADD